MRFKSLILAVSVLGTLPTVANAAVFPSLGGGDRPFVELSSAGLAGGAVATLTGGEVYNTDRPFADLPAGSVFGNNFLAVGPTAGQPASLVFTSALNYLSFLWGSPDTYNRLTVNTNLGSYDYTAESLGFTTTDGDQSVSQYVQFATDGGEAITSVTFTNLPEVDAFETANFSVTAVPEPATWAMMLVGFGMVGAAARYRRRGLRASFA